MNVNISFESIIIYNESRDDKKTFENNYCKCHHYFLLSTYILSFFSFTVVSNHCPLNVDHNKNAYK